jgi:glycerol kinase
VSPGATRSPTAHSILNTVPVMWALIVAMGERYSGRYAAAMLLAIDQGTTSTRAVLFDLAGNQLALARRPLATTAPAPGLVEQDPDQIWRGTEEVVAEVLAAAEPGAVAAVGITNQRETVCVWDPQTGEPLAPAIVWQDRRTAPLCERLKEEGHEPLLRQRTGLLFDPYFSATKIAWLLANVEGLRERARRGRAVFGTVDAFLAFKLCGRFVTDASNASRTALFGLSAGEWDRELLALFGGIEVGWLPEVVDTAGVVGTVTAGCFGGRRLPLAALVGDQQAALFGQGCLAAGEGKNTYGTGAFLLQNAGEAPPPCPDGLLATVGWRFGGKTTYALEAPLFTAGAAVGWLRDRLGILAEAGESERLARSVPSSAGVLFVPALTGLGSPYFNPHARAAFLGLSNATAAAHLVRAVLEGIALQTADALAAMEPHLPAPIARLRVDGGATANGFLMQCQADLAGVAVEVARLTETTALGAAMLAGVGAGLLNPQEAAAAAAPARTYHPQLDPAQRAALLSRYRQAVALIGAFGA